MFNFFRDVLSSMTPLEVYDYPGGAEDELEDDTESIQEGSEEDLLGEEPEPINVDEKLKDEIWANQPVVVTINGKPQTVKRGDVYRGHMKGMAGDEKLREAHGLEEELRDAFGQPSRMSDPFMRDIHDIASAARKDKEGKPSRTLAQIWGDDNLSYEEKMAEAAPILDRLREERGKPDLELRGELDQMRREREFEESKRRYYDEINTEWGEIVKKSPHLNNPDIHEYILSRHSFFDQIAVAEAKAFALKKIGQGFSRTQVVAAWPRILDAARKRFGKTITECAESFEQAVRGRNTKLTESRRQSGAGPGSAYASSPVKANLKDEKGRPLQMGSPEYDLAVEKALRESR